MHTLTGWICWMFSGFAKSDRASGACLPSFVAPLLVAALLLAWPAPAPAEQERAAPTKRDLRFHPLSADELARYRSLAFLGDADAAYLVYEHLSFIALDPSAVIHLRLAAELGHCAAMFEFRNKLRNYDDLELAVRYEGAARSDPRTQSCFIPVYAGLVAPYVESDEAQQDAAEAPDRMGPEVQPPSTSEPPSAPSPGSAEAVGPQSIKEPAVDIPELEARLDTAWFWSVLDTPDPRSPGSPSLEDRLAGLGDEELVAFERHMRTRVRELGTARIYGALHALSGGQGVSDDVFEYLRYWIVYQGEAFFRATTNNPDTLARWIEGDCEATFGEWWSDGEIVGYAAESEILSRGLSVDAFDARVGVGRGESAEDFDWQFAAQLDFPRIRRRCRG